MHRLSIIRAEVTRIFIEDLSHLMVVASHEWLDDVLLETLSIDSVQVEPKHSQFSVIILIGRIELSQAVPRMTGQANRLTKFNELLLPVMTVILEPVIVHHHIYVSH